jgi:hypothetical protein
MLRIPHCLDNRLTDGGKVVSPTHPPHFTLPARNVAGLRNQIFNTGEKASAIRILSYWHFSSFSDPNLRMEF